MNIGIIVYSQTGHTLLVANRLKDKLAAAGHKVTLQQIETVGPVKPGDASVTLKTKPSLGAYDAIVFGCPVHGGQPAAPMASYLGQVASLKGKLVACLVTGFFPSAAWGRNQTLARLQELCAAKGASVRGSGSVGWFNLGRGKEIAAVVEALSGVF